MATLPTHEETDEVLAVRAQEGDTGAFGALMKRYEPKLLRYGRKFLLRDEDIEDAVQDVFLKVYEHMRSYDSAFRFSPWIYRIAHNTYVNRIRRETYRSFAFFDFDTLMAPRSFHEHEEAAERTDLHDALEQGLATLSPKYREVLILHYYESLSYEEIADVLHVPIGTVGVRLKRAREALKAACEVKPL